MGSEMCIRDRVPPLYLPINQPLANCANSPRQYSNGQSFPANAKRNTTRVRKRLMCCVFVCCCCCCCCCWCARGVVVWLGMDVESLVQSLFRLRIVTASFYSSRNSEVARAHITFLPFAPGTHVIWTGYFVVALREAGQIERTGEEQKKATKGGENRVGADQSSENREVPVGVRPETGGRWCWPIT